MDLRTSRREREGGEGRRELVSLCFYLITVT